MIWIILLAALGLAIGIYGKVRAGNDLFLVLFACGLGALAGIPLAGISSAVVQAVVPDVKYEMAEIEKQELAVSEEKDILYFNVEIVGDESYIFYLTSDGKIGSVQADRCRIKFTDSDYRVVHSEKRISEWYGIFVYPAPEKDITFYVPESVWLAAQGE